MYNTLVPGINDLETVNPTLAKEWDSEKNGDLRANMVAANTNKKAWWRCKNGHSWHAVVASRNSGRGCPYCANRKVLAGFNDLATKNPELASEWDFEKNGDLQPCYVSPTSHRYVWWKGKCGHSWNARIANRNFGTGCPYCVGVLVLLGFNDLLSQAPALCVEWDYEANGDLTPDMITVGTNRRVDWKCAEGHRWNASVVNRTHGQGCPFCSNRRVILGETDLQTVYPVLVSEWDFEKNGGLLPTDLTFSTRKKVWWKCAKGHSWRAEVYLRHKGGGCPKCVAKTDKHIVTVGKTDLKTINPTLADEWDYERNGDLLPEHVLPYSNRKVWWRCKNGHRWRCAVQIRMKGTRCPHCVGKIPMQSRIVK